MELHDHRGDLYGRSAAIEPDGPSLTAPVDDLVTLIQKVGASDHTVGLGEDYFEAQARSADLIYEDDSLRLYLGTIDAAVWFPELVSRSVRETSSETPSVVVSPELVARNADGPRRDAVHWERRRDEDGHGNDAVPCGQDVSPQPGVVPKHKSRRNAEDVFGVVSLCAHERAVVRQNAFLFPEPKNRYCENPAGFYRLKGVAYRGISASDNDKYDISRHFAEVWEFVEGLRRRAMDVWAESRTGEMLVVRPVGGADQSVVQGTDDRPRPAAVLIHCIVGSNRSACCVVAFLMRYLNWSVEVAVEHVARRRRCPILANRAFLGALVRYDEELKSGKCRDTGEKAQAVSTAPRAERNGGKKSCGKRGSGGNGQAAVTEADDMV